ncbi:SusD/RagB family nutrient-binding outer membrane lipoprotein [Spirosoma arcticum]
MKTIFHKIIALAAVLLALNGCKSFDELEPNPNVAGEDKTIPPSLLLGRVQMEVSRGGGVIDGVPGNVLEGPFGQVQRWNQFVISNDTYYGGQNGYNWSTSAPMYNVLRNVSKMEEQSVKILNNPKNVYTALGKFFRAYVFVWQTQRVGDAPMMEAGKGLEFITPKFDSQKAIYAGALQLLDEANTELAALIATPANPAATLEGDIFYANDIKKWQKMVNTYKLRVLISLSKRADDTADLGIKQKFADVVDNPGKYPLMASNADNMVFTYNASYNTYPVGPTANYNRSSSMASTYLKLTTATQDPRTFVVATPAPAELVKGKKVDDFTAYVGADISVPIPDLSTQAIDGKFSFTNYLRYYVSLTGPEPYIMVGFSEMNFNIAEGINRGWAAPTTTAATYYTRGINASLTFYGLTEGATLPIGDLTGKSLGSVKANIAAFLANPGVAYKGDNAEGLEQILNQKYVAFFQNSGWEAFYNWRRTGFPRTFISTGSGINAAGRIPRRWQYSVDEQTYNTENYKAAITAQFGGTDDLSKDIWLTK